MRAMACAALALLLAGCSWMGSDRPSAPVPTPADLESGDCHAMANEHEAEAGWLNIDAQSQQRIFKAAYDACQQWKAAHVWSGQ